MRQNNSEENTPTTFPADIENRSFHSVGSLIAVLTKANIKFNISNQIGDPVGHEAAEKACFEGGLTLIIDDGDKRVLKRFLIDCSKAKNIRLVRDFGYKNPYQ
ncbi:hypothetical protein ACVWZA_004398 [Sphingomonas sp. UYAg733]